MRLRKLVVFDRLMARLLIVAPDRWILKGALALDYRLGDVSRTTKDLDLARQDNEAAATEDFLGAQSIHLADYFTFVIEKTGHLDSTQDGAAVRYRASAQLAGRSFEDVVVDVGFGDPVVPAPEVLQGPDLLGFADIAPVTVPALPLEQHIAEKVHAYTRVYAGQRVSTRVKDLVDLVLIQLHATVESGQVRTALDATFSTRSTHPLPDRLSSPPPSWSVAFRRLSKDTGIDLDISVGFARVATFIDPILKGAIPDVAQWEPNSGVWRW